MLIASWAFLAGAAVASPNAAEARVVALLRERVRPGERVVASELAQAVSDPAEKRALDRLFGVFFKLPLFAAQEQQRLNRPPTLAEIGDQFALRLPGEVELLLQVMDADPRMPRFFERDPKTGEILKVDVAAIRAHPRFGQALERSLMGLEGQPAPSFTARLFGGQELSSAALAGRPYLLYFWFTGCPPCTQTAPALAELQARNAARGFTVVAANADQALDLGIEEAERNAHAQKLGGAKLAVATPELLAAVGGVSVFPTLVFVDAKGQVLRQLVNQQTAADLQTIVDRLLK